MSKEEENPFEKIIEEATLSALKKMERESRYDAQVDDLFKTAMAHHNIAYEEDEIIEISFDELKDNIKRAFIERNDGWIKSEIARLRKKYPDVDVD